MTICAAFTQYDGMVHPLKKLKILFGHTDWCSSEPGQ